MNSAVFCAGCIKLSFKIGKTHFKHVFYLIDIPENSKFIGILGFDFLKTHRVLIDLRENLIQINDCNVDIHDAIQEKDIKNIQKIRINNTSEIPNSNLNSDNINDSNSLNVIAKNSQSNKQAVETQKRIKCTLKNKVIIHPKDTVYVFAVAEHNFNEEAAFFEPSLRDSKGISCYKAIVQISKQPLRKKHNRPLGEFAFPITNNTDSSQHINKGTVVGHIYQITEIEEPDKSDISPVSLNLIQASSDIIELRKKEFNISKFNLKHLPPMERSALEKLLKNFDTVFSSSLMSLGHTDHI